MDCKAIELAKDNLRLHRSVVVVESAVLVNHAQEKSACCWWIFHGSMVTSSGISLGAAFLIMYQSMLQVVQRRYIIYLIHSLFLGFNFMQFQLFTKHRGLWIFQTKLLHLLLYWKKKKKSCHKGVILPLCLHLWDRTSITMFTFTLPSKRRTLTNWHEFGGGPLWRNVQWLKHFPCEERLRDEDFFSFQRGKLQ